MNQPLLQIHLDPALKALWPDTALGLIFWSAVVRPEEPRLRAFFEAEVLPELRGRLQNTDMSAMPGIKASRQAYKAFGRDPGRTRVSSEALYRRLRQGKELYRVNSVVDVNNLVSLETGFSLGSYDTAALQGPATFRLGREDESYEAIGKDATPLHRLPLLADAHGPFGNPSADSRRTMVGPGAAPLLTAVYGFSSPAAVETALALACERMEMFADGDILHVQILT